MKEMRRKDRELPGNEARDLLASCEYGILSTVGADGQPYGVPVSYVYKDGFIYFHSAINGHKIENIEQNPRVSFCVVGKTKVLPDKFATEYESAMVFGIASEIQGKERKKALLWLLEKYSPGFTEEGKKYIDQKDKITKVIKITVDLLSGKARR